VTGSLRVQLDLEETLNETQMEAFEAARSEWIQTQTQFSHGFLSNCTVTVQEQRLVTLAEGRRGRFLQVISTTTNLLVDFGVEALYMGSDNGFDLETALTSSFGTDPDQVWIRLLGNYDDTFLPLRPALPATTQDGPPEKPAKTLDSGAKAAIIVVVVSAVLLGLAASVYSIRSHQHAVRGTELVSPKPFAPRTLMAATTTQDEEEDDFNVESMTTASKKDEEEKKPDTPGGGGGLSYGLSCGTDLYQTAASDDEISPMEKGAKDPSCHIFESYTGGRQDPPSAASEIDFGRNRSLFDPVSSNYFGMLLSFLSYSHTYPYLFFCNDSHLISRRLRVQRPVKWRAVSPMPAELPVPIIAMLEASMLLRTLAAIVLHRITARPCRRVVVKYTVKPTVN